MTVNDPSTPCQKYNVTMTLLHRGEEERLQAQTSRYHGVRQNKRSEKWESYIRVAGKHLHLGCHDSEVAAAQAFDQAVMLRHVYCRDGENPSPLVTNFAPEYYQVGFTHLTEALRSCYACHAHSSNFGNIFITISVDL